MLKTYKLLEIKADSFGGKQTPGGNPQLKDDTIIGINEAFSSQLVRVVFPIPVIEEVYKKGKSL
jgi:hypothetical protein